MNIVKTIERFIPDSVLKCYRNSKWQIKHIVYEHRYHRAIERLRKQQTPIRVVFFLHQASNWKYDYLYRMMEVDPYFDVSVLVCERMSIDDKNERISEMEKCYAMCLERGYHTIKGYDVENDKITNPSYLKPDIIFYCNPYARFYREGYFMNNFKKTLICYANYSYEIIPFRWAFTGDLQNLAWKYFCESRGHQQLVSLYSPVKGRNTIVTGYPVIDAYMANNGNEGEWKIADRKIKRIIWAPHQSIYDAKMSHEAAVVQFSTFLLYADFMLELAEKFKDKIQIAFKPHPFLKRNLYNHSEWGQKKTDKYYALWENGENTCFVEGDYIDLFCSSDALIHDSGSFTAEYLCTRKPCMFLATYMNADNMNDMGKGAFECHYKGLNKDDIEFFINEVVLKGNDTMGEFRRRFYEENLLPPNGRSVAENIINVIKTNIGR